MLLTDQSAMLVAGIAVGILPTTISHLIFEESNATVVCSLLGNTANISSSAGVASVVHVLPEVHGMIMTILIRFVLNLYY